MKVIRASKEEQHCLMSFERLKDLPKTNSNVGMPPILPILKLEHEIPGTVDYRFNCLRRSNKHVDIDKVVTKFCMLVAKKNAVLLGPAILVCLRLGFEGRGHKGYV